MHVRTYVCSASEALVVLGSLWWIDSVPVVEKRDYLGAHTYMCGSGGNLFQRVSDY